MLNPAAPQYFGLCSNSFCTLWLSLWTSGVFREFPKRRPSRHFSRLFSALYFPPKASITLHHLDPPSSDSDGNVGSV
ncbi:hypothetical protein JTE90_020390 [Oedothorax gibbosus]|uniref:Uncharacterized protein n=1 Tax=Oedothorax gibbosus TaxID=931172 RepID=A0AAV6UFM8_9ARAC|nr:hypothetical protein JTE90_020390 [Oedothorax gibbosus]